jgi:phosphoglycerate dehydrogenase-like enzyme
MAFDRLVCLDDTRLTPEGIERLQEFSCAEVRCYEDSPTSDEEILSRIRDADGVLVGWRTRLTAEVLRAAAGRLKYVGMCCSLYDPASANVDIQVAGELGITVCGVRDYGDEGVVEFILAQLVFLFQGLGGDRWKDEPAELMGRTLGVIGFGATGQGVARAARAVGMEVLYYSRTRRESLEGRGLSFAPLMEVLSRADAVTTHLPRNTCLLDARAFAAMRPDSVLINTSLGPTFDVAAFGDWIGQDGHHAIFDADGAAGHAEVLSKFSTVTVTGRSAGFTAEARLRLTQKVLDNIRAYLGGLSPSA